jgi:hypothetical protein
LRQRSFFRLPFLNINHFFISHTRQFSSLAARTPRQAPVVLYHDFVGVSSACQSRKTSKCGQRVRPCTQLARPNFCGYARP